MRMRYLAVVIGTGFLCLRTLAGDCYTGSAFVPANRIDGALAERWTRAGIKPSPLCSDGVFVRRVTLDLTGELPASELAAAFIRSKEPDKRSRLIDRLLASEAFTDYWTMKWCDVLRVKSEFPVNLWPNAVQAYCHWIHTAIRSNMPYDRFLAALVTGSGSNFRVGEVNFYRAARRRDPEGLAAAVALTFMGMRLEDRPEQERRHLAAFFSSLRFKPSAEWKEEIVYHDATARPEEASLTLPDGSTVRLAPGDDPRRLLAAWLCGDGRRMAARAAVSRAWFWLFGRGLTPEADDLRPDRPPVSEALLRVLEDEFIASGGDFRRLCRFIVTSSTYQQSCTGNRDVSGAAELFAVYPVRRLDAEVICDALSRITGQYEEYSSVIPEPFTFIPYAGKSVALADGSITSSFLDMFGRSARDSGLLGERNNRVTGAQRLYLLNSSVLQRELQRSRVLTELSRKKSREEILDGLYLLILSRYPDSAEQAVLERYFPRRGRFDRRNAVSELAWALINTKEFIYHH